LDFDLLIAEAKAFSVIIWIRYIAPVGIRRTAGGNATQIAEAIAAMSHMRRNFGKLIMQSVKLFLIVSFTELLNLATSGYKNGTLKINGRSGIKETSVYHSGSLTPLNPKRAK
jgi:hypothetical protein